jgi:hypothetical protein
MAGIPLLEISDDVNALATSLVAGVPLPEKAAIDALHNSVAAINGVAYVLTWNCKHIANPSMRPPGDAGRCCVDVADVGTFTTSGTRLVQRGTRVDVG